VEFAVTDIKEVKWSSKPFDPLVIPGEDREVVIALVEARNRRATRKSEFTFNDVVRGKGRGLNVLLQYATPPLL
jgi:hypothetical protein